MKNIKYLIVVACSLMLVVNCGSTTKRHPDMETKFSLEKKSILVVAEDNATGDTMASTAFKAAAAQKVGSLKILPMLPPGVTGLAKRFAEFGLNDGGKVNTADPAGIALTAVLALGAKLGGTYDTVVFVGAEKAAGFAVPMTIKVEYYAAVYDIASKTVTVSAMDKGTVVQQTAVAQLPLGARSIIGLLLEGEAAPKTEEKK